GRQADSRRFPRRGRQEGSCRKTFWSADRWLKLRHFPASRSFTTKTFVRLCLKNLNTTTRCRFRASPRLSSTWALAKPLAIPRSLRLLLKTSARSEERRVGKESTARTTAQH